MAKTIILLLALSVFAAHCAVLRNNGPEPKPTQGHKREKRSCHVCDETYGPFGPPGPPGPPGLRGPPPPPPPPPLLGPLPVYRTKNWSGLSRSSDGVPQGVFSGAAATADLGSQAFSIASSGIGANTGAGVGAGDQSGAQSNSGPGESAGYGGQSTSNAAAESGGRNGVGYGGQQFASQSYKESHFSSHGSGNKLSDEYGSGATQQVQNAGLGAGAGHRAGVSNGAEGGFGAGAGESFGGSQSASSSSAQSSGSGFSGQQQQLQTSHVQYNDERRKGDHHHVVNNGQSSSSSSEEDSGSPASGQEALSGALELANQGLQHSQQAGCSTCGKNSYAYSKAKTHRGNAVSISVGG